LFLKNCGDPIGAYCEPRPLALQIIPVDAIDAARLRRLIDECRHRRSRFATRLQARARLALLGIERPEAIPIRGVREARRTADRPVESLASTAGNRALAVYRRFGRGAVLGAGRSDQLTASRSLKL
jgi:hypothetical protein